MKLLAGTHYDPSTAATVSTTSLLAMTAMDTTNLRLTFTAPSNGAVLVRARVVATGVTPLPTVLLGILDHTNSDAVKARQAPISGRSGGNATSYTAYQTSMLVTGLTAGQSYTYDFAYGVEVVQATGVLKWGGPNTSSTNDSAGGVSYEIWDAPGYLAAIAYDPGTAVQTAAAVGTVVAALDTTNLRLSFVCPSSGIVMVRLRGVLTGTTATASTVQWAVLDGATVRFRGRGIGGIANPGTLAATDNWAHEATGLVSGLTPGTTYTWDASFTSDNNQASTTVSYGGPNDTTTNNAWGQFAFDVWNPDSIPRMIGSVA